MSAEGAEPPWPRFRCYAGSQPASHRAPAGERAATRDVPDDVVERGADRARMVRRDVDGGVAPDLAQAGQIAEHERTAGEGGLRGGHAERRVPRRGGVNRGARHPPRELRLVHPPEGAEALPGAAADAAGATSLPVTSTGHAEDGLRIAIPTCQEFSVNDRQLTKRTKSMIHYSAYKKTNRSNEFTRLCNFVYTTLIHGMDRPSRAEYQRPGRYRPTPIDKPRKVFPMTIRHTSLAIAATAAAIVHLTACYGDEPIDDDESETAAVKEELRNDGQVEPMQRTLGEGRAMTKEEVAAFIASRKVARRAAEPAQPDAAAPVAQAAALGTCVVDFNQSAALANLINHGYSTFVTGPWYTHQCYNADYHVMLTSLNLDHYHLLSEASNQCYGTGTNWGFYNANGACVNQSDAMYWPRVAANMNGNTGIDVVADGNGYYRTFNLVEFYVKTGNVKVVANRVGIGWWVWYGNSAGYRWTWPANTTVWEAEFFDNGDNGLFVMDDLKVQIID